MLLGIQSKCQLNLLQTFPDGNMCCMKGGHESENDYLQNSISLGKVLNRLSRAKWNQQESLGGLRQTFGLENRWKRSILCYTLFTLWVKKWKVEMEK
jgi:hypothetical protein